MPWILAADFNMEPSVFMDNFWISSLGARVLVPGSPLGTCRQRTRAGITHSCYDYFVCHQSVLRLAPVIELLEAYPSSPHKPVALRIQTRVTPLYRLEQRAPKPLPLLEGKREQDRIRPTDWPALGPICNQEEADKAWAALTDAMEREATGYHEVPKEQCKAMTGRGRLPSWKLVRVLFPRPRDLPRPSARGRQWRGIAGVLADAGTLLATITRRGRSLGRTMQLASTQRRAGAMSARLNVEPAIRHIWRGVLAGLASADVDTLTQQQDDLAGWAKAAASTARHYVYHDRKLQESSWEEFLEKAARGGRSPPPHHQAAPQPSRHR